MIIQEFTLDRYEWFVRVYYLIDKFPKDEILSDLMELGCGEDEALDTVDTLEGGGLNAGSINSNIYRRKSIIVIGMADSTDEFYDTFDHEKGHLAMHISIADDIDPFSEEYQYLAGEIGKRMFKAAKELFCEECRKKYL